MGRLDAEEKEILGAFEGGKLKRAKEVARELERHKAVAEATIRKDVSDSNAGPRRSGFSPT